MLCFRDRSWCVQSTTGLCKNKECGRFFSEEDRGYAVEWWGGEDFPLAITDFLTEGCGFKDE